MKSLVSFSLVIYFFAALQGGLYFMNNRLQELGIAVALALYVYASIHAALGVKNIRWNWWAFAAPLLVLFVLVGYAVIFSLNTGAIILPSILASRYFMLMMIVPAIYFIYRLGYDIQTIERIFIASMVILLFNYLFHFNRIDMQTAFFSKSHNINTLITFDEWRGFRLKAPLYVTLILMLYSAMRVFQRNPFRIKAEFFLVFSLCGYVLFINMSRAAMGSIILALMMYPFFFSRPNRTHLLIMGIPLGLLAFSLAAAVLMQAVISHFTNDWSFVVRMKSYTIAWKSFTGHMIFGFGQASYYSTTYQEIFGLKFYPSDLGIIGVAFKYGLVGVVMYIFFNIYVIVRLLKVNWFLRKLKGQHNPLVWALLIMKTSLFINLILQPGLVFAPGLTLASFSIAYTACWYEELGLKSRHHQVSARDTKGVYAVST